MKKRILAFFLAGIMTLTMTPAEAFAAASLQQEIQVTEEVTEQEEANEADEAKEPEVAAGSEEAVVPEETNESEESVVPEETNEPQEAVVPEETGTEEIAEPDSGVSAKQDEQEINGQVHKNLEETAELLPEETKEAEEARGTLENWMPPVGGVEQKEVEVTPEMAVNAEVIDGNEIKTVNGITVYDSPSLGSQKYDSSWDIYSSNYIYNQLNSAQRTFWDALDLVCNSYLTNDIDAVDYGNGWSYSQLWISYTKLGLSETQAKELFIMFSYSNPQYYFLDSSLIASSGGSWVPFFYGKFTDGSARKTETAKVKAQIDEMESQIAKGRNDVEKAKIAHDLIITKVQYDHDYATSTPNTLYHQSGYSVFCDDYTVCAGYTKAFELLMNGAGIDTMGVVSEGHAWNLISLNDSWYHVDCTWDDADGYAGYEVFYDYFNRSTAMITGDLDQNAYHQMESCYKGRVPKCTLDSNATATTIGTYKTPSATTAAPKITQKKVSGGIQVTLSSTTSGAEIYYTLDGKNPSSSFTRSYRYTKPFKVTSNVTVKAIAVCDTKWDSKVTSAKVYGKQYTVKFNSMGGSKVSSQKVTSNSTIKKPSNPKRAKYTFAGWYTDKKYKKAWNFKTKVTKNTTLYAKWKKVSVARPSISKLTNVSGKKMKVSIKKVSGAKGYVIRYSTNSKFKSAKTVTVKSSSKTITKLKKGKKYYVQVKAYKVDSAGKKVSGKWSKTKTVTIRK